MNDGHISQKFPAARRVRKRREFVFIGKQGRFFSANGVTFQWVRTTRPFTRLGVTASTKCGGAVERNKFRRRVKEAFRRSDMFLMQGVDLNVKARASLPMSYSDICDAFSRFISNNFLTK
jgi:ribonuclease P protein component